MSKNYELFLIFNGKKDDNGAQKSLREVEAILNKNGAKIVKSLSSNNARLAYPINGKQDSYQVAVEVEADPSSLTEISRQLKLYEELLRSVFFTLETI